MRKLIAIIVPLALASGCASFKTEQTDTSYDPAGQRREITTTAKASTFFAGRSALASWKASQTDKTQGASVGGLAVEANAGTNLNAIVEAAVGAAVKAAVRP